MKTSSTCRAAIFFSLLFASTTSFAQVTFDFTGAVQTFVVPAGVTTIQVEAWGGQGQPVIIEDFDPSTGGLGGYATGELAVTPGETLNIFVGGAGADGVPGFNGGGLGGFGAPSTGTGGFAGSGGGASDVRVGGSALADRVIVAGGGGGGGRDYVNGSCLPCGVGGNGGEGGGLTGADGADAAPGTNALGPFPNPGSGGSGGTDSAGGTGGTGTGGSGGAGVSGVGGDGVAGNQSVASGGGGGGFFGGGAGAGASSGSGAAGGGGGGGSSFIGGVTGGNTLAGQNAGNGRIVLNFSASPSAQSIPTIGVSGLLLLSLLLLAIAGQRMRAGT